MIRFKHTLSAVVMVALLFGCDFSKEEKHENWNYQAKDADNQITSTYILPTEVKNVSTSSEADVKNTKILLLNNKGQAGLALNGTCSMKGSADSNAAILIDFGKELHGGIEIVTDRFKGHQPIKIRLTLGESISEALSKVESSTATNDHAMRDFEMHLPWLGKIQVGNSGFRFAKIELLDTKRTLNLKEVRAISVMRDIPYVGSFKCNDERLNKIWQTGAYTVHLNMQDYLWDGIKRDRLIWVGDMHPEVMTILSVFGYNAVVPKSLSQINSNTPKNKWMNNISSYSIWWLLIQHQWYMNTGDIQYLQSNKESIYTILEQLSSKIDDEGKEVLDGMRFVDWPTRPNTKAVHAGLQSLMVMAFKTGAQMATLFNDAEKHKLYLARVEKLISYTPDPNGSKSAGALMGLSGLSDLHQMNDTLLSVNPNQGISTFYGYYVLKARAEAGDITGSLNVIRDYWGGMLAMGATTFWEDFDLSWMDNATRIDEMPDPNKSDIHADNGGFCYVGLRNSFCHGWASGPTAWLSEYVLGVKPIEPGCTKVLVKPNLGDLEWAEGTYPTPYGTIHVKHRKDAKGKVTSTIDAPKEIEIITQ